jgi:hypothetical protein
LRKAAACDSDYIAQTGTLTFSPSPGETTKTITIEVKGDSKKEANETFYLDLFGNSSNALFTTPGNQGEQDRMDLLRVVMQEMGHALGLAHDDDGVMQRSVSAGERLTRPGGDAGES